MSEERTDRYQGILLIGAPASGKGTQSRAIGQLPGFHVFATGQTLRNLDSASDLGREVGKYLESGDLVPSDLMLRVWQSHMDDAIRRGVFRASRDTLLMDAYPRDVEQARLLESHVDFQLIVHLRAENERLLKQRLRDRNARPDDRDESVIEHRFEVYHQHTTPLLDYFPRERIAVVDAAAPPLVVLSKLVEEIIGMLPKN